MTEFIKDVLKDEYYQGFDASKQYQQLLFRAGKGLQSRELNDLQLQVNQQVKGLGDVMMKNGSIVSGGTVVVDTQAKIAKMSEADVYLNGAVHHISATALAISLTSTVVVGVWLTSSVVTELLDPALLDPAGEDSPMRAQNYNEPGAARLQVMGQWGLSDTPQDSKMGEKSEFYPVHQINNGVVLLNHSPAKFDSVTRALARYDRESNGGSYVISGMALNYLNTQQQAQVTTQHYSVQEGKAHIDGFEVALNTALPAAFSVTPDEQAIKNEPTSFTPDNTDKQTVAFDFFPIKQVDKVGTTARKAVQMRRSTEVGGLDLIADFSVTRIISVTQQKGDATIEYDIGNDCVLTGNHIAWKHSGNAPAPNDVYVAEYEYNVDILVGSALQYNETHYTINQQLPDGGQLVENAQLRVDYVYLKPRIDLIVLTAQGEVKRIEGASAIQNPVKPQVPEQHLPLAFVHQSWGSTTPRIELAAIQVVNMADMHFMQSQISDLYQLLAIERLRNDTNAQDSASKYGVFVDPFLDDDLRDEHIAQTAAIIDGELLLPIDVTVNALDNANDAQLLPYELEDVLAQTSQTGTMKVNPYQAFEPVPARVTLTPSVDHWTQTQQVWSSPVTRRFTRGGGRVRRITTRVTTERVGTQVQQLEFLRPRTVQFTISGFGPNEVLASVTFDGVVVTAEETS
ncbi:DUF4815 domain-containing protein [Pseudoalteromonas sp. MMG005]|uniref:DUF4815 domain-containing protein n=1 Tax=Pseudoalteromonas sp. MMG005 TaxID=2822682 RepID=UPI001B3A4058|nr:DUF4815 domain-containing protein [Pseudoalteromonas sp. MMG005]MBQ4844947.1 DUF4815 domain-containing protein [Pseudoalteromonas sp. MMG005]